MPSILTPDIAVSWPLLVAAVTVAGIVLETRWKTGRLERDHDHVLERLGKLEGQAQATEVELAKFATKLDEIKEGIASIREEIRALRPTA